jgi:hypothetical protein
MTQREQAEQAIRSGLVTAFNLIPATPRGWRLEIVYLEGGEMHYYQSPLLRGTTLSDCSKEAISELAGMGATLTQVSTLSPR